MGYIGIGSETESKLGFGGEVEMWEGGSRFNLRNVEVEDGIGETDIGYEWILAILLRGHGYMRR